MGRAGNDQKHIRLEESADVIEETTLYFLHFNLTTRDMKQKIDLVISTRWFVACGE